MGRLTPALRKARADARACDRIAPDARAWAPQPGIRAVVAAAREAGRSCYFRPLFDRPRHWAAHRTPRVTHLISK